MGRPSKPLISRTATLRAALKIIGEEGLEALSIRRLGRALNVQGISLYHHFHDKEDILAGVCELALAPLLPLLPIDDGNWREWFVKGAIRYRDMLRQYPNLIPILMRRHPLRIGQKASNEAAGLLAVHGVPPEAIMPLIETIDIVTLGHVGYQPPGGQGANAKTWDEDCPYLAHLDRKRAITHDDLFELLIRNAVDAVIAETTRRDEDPRHSTKAPAIP